MAKVTPLSQRKTEHIRINLEEDVQSGLTTGLERYRFYHQALPEVNLDDISLEQTLFNRQIRSPLLISSMTGGTDYAAKINHTLAEAAQVAGVAIGLGSQRVALEHPETAYSFQIRKVAPDTLIFANLGAIQLNYGYGVAECQRAVEMVEADALILHLNALQEAVQPEGNTRFSGLLKQIERVCRALPVPVIAKEVGWGISERVAGLLADAGVAAIDVAGAGGTSWSQVEKHRATSDRQAQLAAAFVDWGIPTADSILQVRKAAPQMMIFASGGLRSGVDIAKCIALGARLGGMASPFLRAAVQSTQAVIELIEQVTQEIRVCMFAAGAANLDELSRLELARVD